MKKVVTVDYIMAACKTFFNRLTNYVSNPVILQTRNNIPTHQQIATLKRNQYTKYGIPEPPMRPKTAFFRFKELAFPQIQKDNPELKIQEIVRLIGNKWAEYPQEKKELMKQETKNDLKTYKKDFEIYKSSLTPEMIEKLEDTKKKITLKKESSLLKKKQKLMEKPKRPASAYTMYCRDKYKDNDSSLSFLEKVSLSAAQWKREDASVIKKYKDVYAKQLIEYNENLKQWEQKMIDSGNFDMLGTKKLRKLHKEFQEKAKS